MDSRLICLSLIAMIAVGSADCATGRDSPGGPSATAATVRVVFRGSTVRRSDLPASAEACAGGVGVTHAHPSWRSFAAIPLQPVPPDRYEITFADVPVNTIVSFRVNDQNWCDQNPTGAALRNVFANDVELVQNTLTPGSGQEPGFAFTVDAAGRLRQ
jgi:hypothetical protein